MNRFTPYETVNGETERVPATKEELEKVKLELEIAELRRTWKPVYTVNVLIAVCSLSVLFITGSFQASSLRLENQRVVVEQQAREFELKRDALHQEVDRLKAENTGYKDERDKAVLEANRSRSAQTAAEIKLAKLGFERKLGEMLAESPMKQLHFPLVAKALLTPQPKASSIFKPDQAFLKNLSPKFQTPAKQSIKPMKQLSVDWAKINRDLRRN